MNDDGGRMVPEAFAEDVAKYSLSSLYAALGIKPRPLTRRERLRARINVTRWYFRHLWLALRNDCDRADW